MARIRVPLACNRQVRLRRILLVAAHPVEGRLSSETMRLRRWWREEAKRLRGVGERYKNLDTLQPSLCALADEYDRIADLLEQEKRPAA